MSNLANNNMRRRKTTRRKSKSKHTAIEAEATTSTINTTKTIDFITNGSLANSSNGLAPTMANERLQRYSLNDILAGMMHRATTTPTPTTIKQINSSSSGVSYTTNDKNIYTKTINNNNTHSATFVLRPTPTSTLCNGSIVCCHDVNCSLNTLNGSLSTIIQQQQQQQQQQTVQRSSFASNVSTSSRSSHSPSSRRSLSSTTTSCKQEERQETTDITTLVASDETALCDNSPDLVTNSVAETEKLRTAIADFAATDVELSAPDRRFTIDLQLDISTWLLFTLAACTRFYKLSMPRNVIFDEIHYGKSVSCYMRNIFFFDQHPPLGKQLIAAVAHLASGYNGNYTFPFIGAEYNDNVPIFWLRFVPALCGSALAPIVYKLLLAARLSAWFALLGGLLIIFDNALLTQSRFILMESMLLFFSASGLFYFIRFQNSRFGSIVWLMFGLAAASCLTFAASVKYAGFITFGLTAYLCWSYLWDQLYDTTLSNLYITLETFCRLIIFTVVPTALYIGIFYIHLQTLYRAGPHDNAMTSAFQASLQGGLASITKGQPIKVVHGSQITLRHTHGRTCWLHSHPHLYPIRYPDERGSSHQQQVTCYSFKDVYNWWIVKRPDREDLVVDDELDVIKHGDIIQLVHGITSRGLNSHDVAAPMTPQCQEVSCYIDYDINMAGELLWRVEILNRDREGQIWHAIKSQVRLIHHTTGAALRFSGNQLPEWGFNQHEVVADRNIDSKDAIWNVEEHRYTKNQRHKDRERELLNAQMIPTKVIKLTFIEKFFELQTKMLLYTKQMDDHMYSSTPLEWPLLDKADRTLFLHHYLPAYLFKILLLCYVFEHIDYLLRLYCYVSKKSQRIWVVRLYRLGVLFWLISVIWVFIKFLPITYGLKKLSSQEVMNLRWKDTWDFILQREDSLKYLFE
ncbi:protein O-mannosyltransferase 1 isoform X2 [Eurosta solidaginis]|uniref:protein O-mannosyltransferase 1 isoform X2 n=1 Tax=Eurosta solidaginis TaxID=178769 RepID=UPI003530A672